MYSIYHFFHSLFQQKHLLKKVKKLDKFPFNKNLLSCRNEGIFPDMAIRLNKDKSIFIGGELIELKEKGWLNDEKGRQRLIEIKVGIPFVPSFLVGYLLSYYIGVGWVVGLL